MTLEPTKDEIKQAADVLRRLPRGFLPLEVFLAFAEKTVLPTLELAPLRIHNDTLEILLTQRPADDPYWPNGWHIPGGVLRATDKAGDYSSIFKRILEHELHGEVTLLSEPQFVAIKFHDVKRGREIDQLYFVEIEDNNTPLTEGKFFNVNALPDGLLEQYDYILPEIIEAYHNYKHPIQEEV